MTNLHILSDPVSDFWKCPKKGFNKKLFMAFFSSEFYHHTCATIAPMSHMRAGHPAFPVLSHDHHGTLSRLYAMKTTFKSIWITLFSEKQQISGRCRQRWQRMMLDSISLICNVDISWHQFSIDCDKMWNKVSYYSKFFICSNRPWKHTLYSWTPFSTVQYM